ncbi:transcriptional regulator with XRE-family HTH domain [Rhizobium sp. BK650]|uniref:helix-turn-helix domain-containing protein n=1 Tax=Rhizobium sp. BK650 TaxID=2586990 RepID=UPI00161F24FF|nr:helix-turn-helix transcriptional regulator [Rhizobium sp. BK650]MBB3659867.1 transcriptional regulator with XRE-family HTH domain [Rhizobium sp. BK650]
MKDQELNLAIGQRLRSVRTARGITQSELAAHIGVAFQQVQKYENGINRLSIAVMLRLCSFMKVDAGWFVSGIETEAGAGVEDEAAYLTGKIGCISDEKIRRNLTKLIHSLTIADAAS